MNPPNFILFLIVTALHFSERIITNDFFFYCNRFLLSNTNSKKESLLECLAPKVWPKIRKNHNNRFFRKSIAKNKKYSFIQLLSPKGLQETGKSYCSPWKLCNVALEHKTMNFYDLALEHETMELLQLSVGIQNSRTSTTWHWNTKLWNSTT